MIIGAGIRIGPGLQLIPVPIPDPAWELVNARFTGSPSLIGRAILPVGARGIRVSPAGDRFYVTSSLRQGVFEYPVWDLIDLATNASIYPYEVGLTYGSTSSGQKEARFGITSLGAPTGLDFKTDGTVMYVTDVGSGSAVYAYNVNTAWQTQEIAFWNSFSLGTQMTTAASVRFKDDGLSMYALSSTPSDAVHQYNLTSAWNVETSVFVSSYILQAGEGTPTGLAFSNDGSKMYVVGSGIDRVHQYNLTSNWLSNTASYYANVSVSGQETAPQGVHFGDNGRFMYIVGATGDDVTRYHLGTPWDVATANTSNSTVSYSTIASTSPVDIYVRDNGEDFYILDSAADAVFRNKTFNTWSVVELIPGLSLRDRSTTPAGFVFDGTGSNLYLASGNPRNEVVQYRLSTPWRTHTASFFANVTFASLGFTQSIPNDIYASPDSGNVYLLGNTGSTIHQLQMSSLGNILTASNVAVFNVVQDTNPRALYFTDDGLSMFIASGRATNEIFKYTLSTPWNLSTATYSNEAIDTEPIPVSSGLQELDGLTIYNANIFTIVAGAVFGSLRTIPLQSPTTFEAMSRLIFSEEGTVRAIALSDNGHRLFTLGSTGDAVDQYTMTVPYSLNNLRYVTTFAVSNLTGTTPTALAFSADGTRMYVGSSTGGNQNVFQYNLSSAWNVATGSISYYANYRVGFNVTGIFISPDSSNIFLSDDSTDAIVRYSMSTPGNITTMSNAGNRFATTPLTAPNQLVFNPDGTRMYLVDSSLNNVNQYNLTAAWNVATAVSNTVISQVTRVTGETTLTALAVTSNGRTFYTAGTGTDTIYKFNLES